MSRSSSATSAKGAKKEISALAKYYLVLYNAVQTLGWSLLLYQLVTYYTSPAAAQEPLYDRVKWSMMVFQNAAVLEVVHAAVRIVPSNPVITAIQVASRVIVVCGVVAPTAAAKLTAGLPLALLAWSVTEVIRYANYTLSLLGVVPYFLKWLRYTTFIVLYPIGVTGELLCLYNAQGEVAETKIFTYTMPNQLNFIFNYQYCLIFIMLMYIPLFPQMYLHMFAQRRKVLGGPTKKDN